MQGKLKKLKDNNGSYVYPVTVAESVFVESNKTLKEAIADGSLGGSGGTTEVSVSGRGYAIFSLRGAKINARKNTDDNTINYSFPTLDTNRYRRLFVWTAGATLKTIDIPDGVLLDNDALIYNVTTNTLTTRNGTWGNIALTANEYALLYNNLGNLGGILSKYCVLGEDSLAIPIREIEAVEISSTGSTQGIFIVDGNIYKCTHSNDLHTDYATISSTGYSMTHNFGHLNAPNYSHVKDSFIVGNGSKDYTLLPKGWIIPNFKSKLVNGSVLEFNTVDKIELDFTQLTGEYKGQLCWGYESSDIVYLFTNDNRIIRKILLGKGTENKGLGTFIDGTASDRYNGSYSIINTWISRTDDILGGMFFYKGSIYSGVKGSNNIRKCILLNNGYFDSEYIPIVGATGDMQGIAIYNNEVYAYTDYKGYKFSVSEL